MRRDDPLLLPQVLGMFRRGYDTMSISHTLEIKESIIERVLHAALAGEKVAKSLLKEDGEGHA
jgi:hypothetical protein